MRFRAWTIFAFAKRSSRNLGQDRFCCPLVKENSSFDPGHLPSFENQRPRHTCECLRRSAPISRFCHRDPAPDATSPGAVSRFGLAPVHHTHENTRAASLGIGVVERLLQHDTKSGHTLMSPSHLARVDQPKPGHAFLSFGGCERRAIPLARSVSLSRNTRRPREPSPRNLRAISVKEKDGDRAPARRISSTLGHRRVRVDLGETPPLRADRGSSESVLSAKSERLLVNRGAFHRQDDGPREDRSSHAPAVGLLVRALPCGSPFGVCITLGVPTPL